MRIPYNFELFKEIQQLIGKTILPVDLDSQFKKYMKDNISTNSSYQIKVLYNHDKKEFQENYSCVDNQKELSSEIFFATINDIIQEDKHTIEAIHLQTLKQKKNKYHHLVIRCTPKTPEESTITAMMKYKTKN
ncbi:hypothetical protein K9M74_04175 [Candidatus Woesearchaeota archaeon]|nr:hypothetical protein [Candidatus Woesearchaeota archaeon]